ncbi:MAG: peptidylprolyl isomerase [Candidatus Delongbacteria bacterium]|nr:MAG: peptidylprolyl isomerase [Candidatus Delongbacteria bacterium]
MKISEKTVVVANYTLYDDNGTLIEDSNHGGPIHFIPGNGFFPKAIEAALLGKELGDSVEVSVGVEEGFGPYDKDLLIEANIEDFKDFDPLEVGVEFELDTEEGVIGGIVSEIKDDKVVGDCNHPLAGMAVKFEFEILEVREATKKELSQGFIIPKD